jgi:hypothetical protein
MGVEDFVVAEIVHTAKLIGIALPIRERRGIPGPVRQQLEHLAKGVTFRGTPIVRIATGHTQDFGGDRLREQRGISTVTVLGGVGLTIDKPCCTSLEIQPRRVGWLRPLFDALPHRIQPRLA